MKATAETDVWKSIRDELKPTTSLETNKLYDHVIHQVYSSSFDQGSTVMLVHDYRSCKCVFVSDNVVDLLGYSTQEFYDDGLIWAIQKVLDQDHASIIAEKVVPKMIEVYKNKSENEVAENFLFAFDFKAKRNDGSYIWLKQEVRTILSDDKGMPLVGVMYLTPQIKSVDSDSVDYHVYKKETGKMYENIFSESYSPKIIRLNLSKREEEILTLIKKGCSTAEIADALFISTNTVDTHRKNILAKSSFKNMVELIAVFR